MTFVANCRDVFFPSPSRRPLWFSPTQRKAFPGQWWIQKPYKNQESHLHDRNLSSVAPYFLFDKEKFLTGAGQCGLSSSQRVECWMSGNHGNDENLAHQNSRIAISGDFRIDGAKSPENPAETRGFGLRNRSPKSQIASGFPSHP